MSQPSASEPPTSKSWALFSIRFASARNFQSLRFRVFQRNRPPAEIERRPVKRTLNSALDPLPPLAALVKWALAHFDAPPKQWDGRPHSKRHRCAKVEALINHLNRGERPL